MSTSAGNMGLLICRCDMDVRSVDYGRLENYLKNLEPNARIFFVKGLCKNPSIVRGYVKLFILQSILVVGCSLYRDVIVNEVEGAGLNPLLVEVIPHRELFTSMLKKDSGDKVTAKLTIMINSSIEKLKLIEPVRHIRPRRVRSYTKLSRRGLLRAIPQFLTVYEPTPIVYREKCIGTIACSFCVNVCPRRALSSLNGRVEVSVELCSLCGICASVCPTGAIQIPNATDEQIEAQLRKIVQDFNGEIPCKMIAFVDSKNYRRILEELSEEEASLPIELFPIELPTLGLLSENHFLAAISYGACSVVVLTTHEDDDSLEYLDILHRKINVAKDILETIGLNPPPIHLIDFRDAELLLKNLNGLRDKYIENPLTVKPITRSYIGDRRAKFVSMIRDLSCFNRVVDCQVQYGEPCPFGEVVIDGDRCTLCGLCYEKCPTKSFTLIKEIDMLHLGFIYKNCLGCNLCSSICPENAITLRRYLSICRLLDDQPVLLVSQEFVECSRCGRPFITRGKLIKLQKIYRSLGVEDADKIQSIKLCPECRKSKIVPAEYDKWFIYR